MKTISFLLLSIYILSSFVACTTKQEDSTAQQIIKGDKTFYIVADVGRNGFYKQKDVAHYMGVYSEKFAPSFIISAGDCFHMRGVQSTQDPIFLTNYELVYGHPNLHCEWYPVLGNHEYQGNTQAVIEYSNISRRWVMPDRYYTFVEKVNDSTTVRFIAIDTPPLLEKYRTETEKYPDAQYQNHIQQLQWIDSVLRVCNATWKIVYGHHPILSEDTKNDDEEKTELIANLQPILEKHAIDFYISGHIHTFQHLQDSSSNIDYIVSPSGSLGRPALHNQFTRFAHADEGFILSTITHTSIHMYTINYDGTIIYSYTRSK